MRNISIVTLCASHTTVRLKYLCVTDINECADNPCKHGNCTDGINSYTCECDDGYEGDDCDIGEYIFLCGVQLI